MRKYRRTCCFATSLAVLALSLIWTGTVIAAPRVELELITEEGFSADRLAAMAGCAPRRRVQRRANSAGAAR